MADFGVPLTIESMRALTEERKMLRFGHPPRRIEILNFLDGCDTRKRPREPWLRRSVAKVSVLSLNDYVATKKASGRPKAAGDLVLRRSAIGSLQGDD